MPGAIGDPRQADDAIVYVDMVSTNNTATRGDYLAWSGKSVIAVLTATPGATYLLYSGIGIALDNNPTFVGPDLSASALGRMPVGRRGIFRVSAVTGEYSAGTYCFPVMTGSGIVAQTGRTGQAAMWSATAILGGLKSANSAIAFYATAVGSASGIITAFTYVQDPTSAVGQIMRVIAAGATGQWDVVLFSHATNPSQAPMIAR